MDEKLRNDEIAKFGMNQVIEFQPKEIVQIDPKKRYNHYTWAKFAALGIGFDSVVSAFQTFVLGQGGSGLYQVTVPSGMHLAKFKDEFAFLGSSLNDVTNTIGGQARLSPVGFDPSTICMAAVLFVVLERFDDIQETQIEIMDFLKLKEKTKLRADLVFLTDVQNEYRFNWNNPDYVSSNHIKVLDIRQDAERAILHYRVQLKSEVEKKDLLHGNKAVENKIQEIRDNLIEYQLALYLYAYSSYLEVMLLENFSAEYLDQIIKKIDNYLYDYRELYTTCSIRLQEFSESSVGSQVLKSLSEASQKAGEAIAKVPVLSKAQIDENLIGAGEFLNDYKENSIEASVIALNSQKLSSDIAKFKDNVITVKKMYNRPFEIVFDKDNLYIDLEPAV